MSAQTQVPATTDAFVYPADVLEFAAKQGILDRLEPLRLATLRLFPTGALTVKFVPDAEMKELDAILFEVTVKVADVPDLREAERVWFAESRALMPRPSKIIEPILSLRRVR